MKLFSQIFVSVLIFVCLGGISQPLMARQASADSEPFNGEWVGRWDGIYTFCLQIRSIDESQNAVAVYRWQEQPNGAFSRSEKSIRRINRNSLKLGNIWLVLDPKDSNKALALGIFKVQSRQSMVLKNATEKPPTQSQCSGN